MTWIVIGQVRKLAEAAQLPTMLRKDSQGICFLGKLKFDYFLHHYLGENAGDVVYLDEMTVVGESDQPLNYPRGGRRGGAVSGGVGV